MRKIFNEKYVFYLLSEMESKYSAEILDFGSESWPITKMFLFRTFSNKTIDFESKKIIFATKTKRLKFNFKKIICLCKSFFYKKNIINKNIISETKNIFFSRSVYLDRLSSGTSFDRIVDPLYLTSKANVKSLKYFFDRKFLNINLYTDGYLYNQNYIKFFIPNIFKKSQRNLTKECIFFLENFLKLNNLLFLEKTLYSELKFSINAYINAKSNAKYFLKKFKSLKKIFLTSWYFPDAMGLIAAANELKLVTYDIQHGKQGQYQSAYSGWNFIPQKGFFNLPTYYLCWGEKSVNDILKASPNREFHLPLLGGYSWPKWYKTFISNKENKSLTKIRLLFTMQRGKVHNKKEPIEEGLIKLVEKYDTKYKNDFQNEFHLKIRIHPNQIEESLIYLKKRLGKLYKSPVISFSSKLDCCLYDDLNWATHHLTNFSSCAIESIAFNIKSAVYGDHAYEIYREEIQKQTLFFLKKCDLEDLINWININNNLLSNNSTDYIKNKFPNPNYFIS